MSDPPSTESAPSSAQSTGPSAAIDTRRYRRLLRFFLRATLHLLCFDLILGRPFLRWLRPEPLRRWRRLAQRYRALALDMGGVLIKLGQYLSTRVDLLPREVIAELKGLQDEVPAESYEDIEAVIQEAFSKPLAEVFPDFDPQPLGAASLAQVHRARLVDGQEAVVKVLRPGIEVLVETDLRALGKVLGWLKHWRFVRRRVDLDWLLEEFAFTTRRELDLEAEGRHAERFAENFANDPEVRVPKIFWRFSRRQVLTEENVAFLKITDQEALRLAGIDRPALARMLYRTYMRQIFEHGFVHADPHPGNLFVCPLDSAGESEHAFQVVFIDFGMVAEVPERLEQALETFLVGLGRRDAGKVVQALSDGGLLLPGANLAQIEEALEGLFDRFWGLDAASLNRMVRNEAANLIRELGALLLETPIQVQADMAFIGRAIELLAGVAIDLDPSFNPWTETIPFAEVLAARSAPRWRERLGDLLLEGQQLAGLPRDLSRSAALASRGRLVVRGSLAPDARQRLERIERAVDRLAGTALAASLLLAGALLYPANLYLGLGFLSAGLVGFLVLFLRRWLR